MQQALEFLDTRFKKDILGDQQIKERGGLVDPFLQWNLTGDVVYAEGDDDGVIGFGRCVLKPLGCGCSGAACAGDQN